MHVHIEIDHQHIFIQILFFFYYYSQLPVTYFGYLDEVIDEAQQRMLLWNSIDEWSKSIDVWHELSFHTLNIDEVVAINEKVLNNCQLLAQRLPANKIVPKLGADAELMKLQLPTIKHLRNPSLRSDHWTKIEQIIKREGLLNESVTLCVFEEANVFDAEISQQIIEISRQATIQQKLEALLQEVDDSWKELELTFVPFHGAKDAFLLTDVDRLQCNLDESMMKVNTVASSDYVDHIRGQMEEWIRTLNMFEATLNIWCSCQQNYIQLENIFSVVDMQRNLPNETMMLAELDKSWRTIMSAAHKSPHALQCMTNGETNEELRRILNGLETIRKCFEQYLNAKRHIFTRYSYAIATFLVMGQN